MSPADLSKFGTKEAKGTAVIKRKDGSTVYLQNGRIVAQKDEKGISKATILIQPSTKSSGITASKPLTTQKQLSISDKVQKVQSEVNRINKDLNKQPARVIGIINPKTNSLVDFRFLEKGKRLKFDEYNKNLIEAQKRIINEQKRKLETSAVSTARQTGTSGLILREQLEGVRLGQAIESLPASVFKEEFEKSRKESIKQGLKTPLLTLKEKEILSDFRKREEKAFEVINRASERIENSEKNMAFIFDKILPSFEKFKATQLAKGIVREVFNFGNPFVIIDATYNILGRLAGRQIDLLKNKELRNILNKVEGRTRVQATKDFFKNLDKSLKRSASSDPIKFSSQVLALAVLLLIPSPAGLSKSERLAVRNSVNKKLVENLKISSSQAKKIIDTTIKNVKSSPFVTKIIKNINFDKTSKLIRSQIKNLTKETKQVKKSLKSLKREEKSLKKEFKKLPKIEKKAKKVEFKKAVSEARKKLSSDQARINKLYGIGFVNKLRKNLNSGVITFSTVNKILKESNRLSKLQKEINNAKFQFKLDKIKIDNEQQKLLKLLNKQALKTIITKNDLQKKAFFRKIKSLKTSILKKAKKLNEKFKSLINNIKSSIKDFKLIKKIILVLLENKNKLSKANLELISKVKLKINSLIFDFKTKKDVKFIFKDYEKEFFKELSKNFGKSIKSEKDIIKALKISQKIKQKNIKLKGKQKVLQEKRLILDAKSRFAKENLFLQKIIKSRRKRRSTPIKVLKAEFDKKYSLLIKLLKQVRNLSNNTLNKIKVNSKKVVKDFFDIKKFVLTLEKRLLGVEGVNLLKTEKALLNEIKRTNLQSLKISNNLKKLEKIEGKKSLKENKLQNLKNELFNKSEELKRIKEALDFIKKVKNVRIEEQPVNLVNSLIQKSSNLKKNYVKKVSKKFSNKSPSKNFINSFSNPNIPSSTFQNTRQNQLLLLIDDYVDINPVLVNKKFKQEFGFNLNPKNIKTLDLPKPNEIKIFKKPIIKSKSRIKPLIKIKPTIKSGFKSSTKANFISSVKPKTNVNIKFSSGVKFKPAVKISSSIIPKRIIDTKSKIILRSKTLKKFKISRVKLPRLKQSKSLRKIIKRELSKTGSKYKPTLIAVLENITSNKPPSKITGAEIRPIIKKLISKRKK